MLWRSARTTWRSSSEPRACLPRVSRRVTHRNSTLVGISPAGSWGCRVFGVGTSVVRQKFLNSLLLTAWQRLYQPRSGAPADRCIRREASLLSRPKSPIGHFLRLPARNRLLFESICVYTYIQNRMRPAPAGPPANRLRRRKRQLVSRLHLPPDALPGSLALTHRRCGKPSCHCADGQGDPLSSLTFMVHGKKRVEHIPQLWVDAVRQRVDLGRQFKEALAEVLVLNAEILVLERKQQPRKNSQKRTAH